ncbi:Uncharacterised protein [Mycobacteroides abscessus subsp. abscessus]|nr:Uncharacterised protein [Mycobacteroides abscessus subsp. abscessus]
MDLCDDAAAQLVNVSRGEHVGHQSTQPVMVRGVTEQHGAPESMHGPTLQLVRDLGQAEAQRLVGLAESAVAERRRAIVVATQYQHPRSRNQDGARLSQPSERFVRSGCAVIGE